MHPEQLLLLLSKTGQLFYQEFLNLMMLLLFLLVDSELLFQTAMFLLFTEDMLTYQLFSELLL